ncbi:MAG: phospholipase A, partial [Muribaculaceae bacterium]|nr:phospholipase A [Muribaculaceae bacterium]
PATTDIYTRLLLGSVICVYETGVNTTVEFGYKISKNDNQYLFFQYFNGYGEGLLDYKTFRSEFRIGMVIRPKYFSDF